jgi:quinol-cytochrome oxidoreductase complex cytochrome b subunit
MTGKKLKLKQEDKKKKKKQRDDSYKHEYKTCDLSLVIICFFFNIDYNVFFNIKNLKYKLINL